MSKRKAHATKIEGVFEMQSSVLQSLQIRLALSGSAAPGLRFCLSWAALISRQRLPHSSNFERQYTRWHSP